MSFPEVTEIRSRIQKTNKLQAKYCFIAEYLFCARISEIIGRKCPSDVTTTARELTGNDAKQTVVRVGSEKYDAVIFTVRTAKRYGKERKIALPLDKRYEPFTEGLFNYVSQFSSNHVFPFTRQKAWKYAEEIFGNLRYPIESYKPFLKGKAQELVKEHLKPFRTHALRHLRATELIEVYDFTGVELSLYGGWTLRSMVGVGSALGRYSHVQWKKYFPKLLQER